jgi:glycosyltransferase involved in cell wall biosynthesis
LILKNIILQKILRKELDFYQKNKILLVLVRMTHPKDPLTLIRAIRKVKDKTNDIVFLLMGDGDLLEDAKH